MTEKSSGARSPVDWTECSSPSPAIGAPVQTACGGTVQYCVTTPCVIWRGQTIYFCLPICKADFEIDPNHSCVSLNASGGCR